jgi:hypothetical protein
MLVILNALRMGANIGSYAVNMLTFETILHLVDRTDNFFLFFKKPLFIYLWISCVVDKNWIIFDWNFLRLKFYIYHSFSYVFSFRVVYVRWVGYKNRYFLINIQIKRKGVWVSYKMNDFSIRQIIKNMA